jgi:hypothetical protein
MVVSLILVAPRAIVSLRLVAGSRLWVSVGYLRICVTCSLGCDPYLISLESNRKTILVELVPELIPSSWR